MVSVRSDIIGGAFSAILGILLLVWLIPVWVEPDPDLRLPVSLMPQIVAWGFVLCGVALVLRTLLSKDKPAQKETINNPAPVHLVSAFDRGEVRGLLLMIVLLLLSTMAFQHFHFLLVAPLIVAMSMWMYSTVRLWSVLLTASICPFAIWLLATQLLGRVVP